MEVTSDSIDGGVIRILVAGTVRIGIVSAGESHLVSSKADVLSNALILAGAHKS